MNAVSKINRLVSNRLFRLFGKDALTRTSIRSRPDLVCLGSSYGGWTVPADVLNGDSICYCVGCGEDISFDLELIERFGCHVWGFDPTPRAIEYVNRVAVDNPQYHFSDFGIWNEDATLKFFAPQDASHVSHSLTNLQQTSEFIEVDVRRLSRVMQDHGHTRIDLLKLDIEGAEYKVLESVVNEQLDVRVLCVEYDECYHPLDKGYRQRIAESVGQLREYGFEMVYAEGNGNYTFLRNG
jgi:FkbM family methyltransferase